MTLNDAVDRFADIEGIIGDRAGPVGKSDVVGLDVETAVDVVVKCALERRQIEQSQRQIIASILPKILLVVRIG
jgi:hypothetical protein